MGAIFWGGFLPPQVLWRNLLVMIQPLIPLYFPFKCAVAESAYCSLQLATTTTTTAAASSPPSSSSSRPTTTFRMVPHVWMDDGNSSLFRNDGIIVPASLFPPNPFLTKASQRCRLFQAKGGKSVALRIVANFC